MTNEVQKKKTKAEQNEKKKKQIYAKKKMFVCWSDRQPFRMEYFFLRSYFGFIAVI